MGKEWKQWETLILGSKITADDDCSHEMKRHLLFGRKAMTNLDSMLKTRDITLPTKVHLVKAMIFPVVLYRCKSWTVKKVKCRRIDAFKLWCWRRLLRVLWTAKISNQSILKEVNLEYSLEGLILKLKLQHLATWYEELIHWKRHWCWKKIEGRSRRGWENETIGCHEFERTLGDGEGQESLACCSPWGHKELDTTEQLNNDNKSQIFWSSRSDALSDPTASSHLPVPAIKQTINEHNSSIHGDQ